MSQAHHLPVYLVIYFGFFSLLLLAKKQNGIRLLNENGPVTNLQLLIGLHVGGFLLFAAVPYYAFDESLREVIVGKTAITTIQLSVIAALLLTAIIIGPILSEKQFRKINSNAGLAGVRLANGFLMNYFIVRILFLVAYESWFRGFLLFDSTINWGLPFAIIINIAFYTFLHAVNDKNEMLACIPFGLLLCLLCTWVNAAWPAILIHVVLTISCEVHLVKRIIKPTTHLV